MTNESSDLGTCPLCESPVPASQLLAVFGSTERTTFAECPACGDIVAPTDAPLPEKSNKE
ncbi:hypothetical protein [Halorarius litoreus]|uniref:DUF7837 family putative zinc-binding protein n=1 Tax=Halorarius litoreus TaxID=2962676 RepID=UPI0020CC05B8|nr:hypothetical protein [Halorarius litoreus]